MNPARPVVTHVAVSDGRILGAGSLNELEGFGDYTLDDRFAQKVLMPGMVEGHSHAVEGKWSSYVTRVSDTSLPVLIVVVGCVRLIVLAIGVVRDL